MINSIKCPNCGEEVEISRALKHELEEKAISDLEKKHTEELKAVSREAEEKITKRMKDQFETQLTLQREDLEDSKKRNKELLNELSEMGKLIRELKKRDEERELDMEKKMLVTEEKIRVEVKKKTEEGERLKLLEKEKQLADALKVNEELKRKLQQGSQQNQGEVLELELEEMLNKEFPNDKIRPVGKGVKGGDIIQEIWDRYGNRCGVILWELKNAKWNKEWIDKLKNDQREIKADLAVLISEIMPDDIKVAAYKDGIWISSRGFIIGIAMALRANVIQAYHIRKSVQGKNLKMEVLYNYLSGVEFKQRVEAIVDAFTNMQEELEKERRLFTAKWARQEKYIRQVIDNTHGMHGDLKGIMGATLPEIKSLESVNELLPGKSL